MKEPAPMDRMAREETIFHAAVQLRDAAKQALYLEMACDGDAALRARIEKLILADSGDIPLRPQLAKRAASGAQSVSSETASGQSESEPTGERIGRYKLLQKIGEGGCGVVYMAEQEEPVRRRVALKIIKLGMDTKSVIARFEAERQALALMDHPNIAKVFDAGSTENGRPYFVMELVRGTKITDYCDEKQLSTRERLELFGRVCHAIQHAHQKGIIHRDIKPSNVLVTVNDGVAVPKVIDFGIAKATTDQRLTDKTVFTAFEQFIGTPAYMSPEQAEITSVDVDTRSDIYSLGVLLYELLTGKTPFDPKELLQAGLDAMRRTIREKEPTRPSTRVSALGGDELTTTAKRRGLEPPKLVNLLRGDLDWIVMRCLEKDRGRRYETANGLAMDIQRHLSNEPVVACPPSNIYRLKKMVRRNKLAFGAAGAVTAALLLGLGLSTWMFLRERQARQRALAAEKTQSQLRQQAEAERQKSASEATKSQQIAQFLKDMLQGVGPSVAMGRDTTLIKEILDKTAERVGKELTNQPEVEAELRTTMGECYFAIQRYEEAVRMHSEALAIRKKIFGNESLEVAASLHNLGWARGFQAAFGWGRLSDLLQAEADLREAVALRRKLLGDENADTAHSLYALACDLNSEGIPSKRIEAEKLHREALAIRTKLLGPQSLETADSLKDLSLTLQSEGKLAEAEKLARDAHAVYLGGDRPEVFDNLHDLSGILWDEGRLQEAEAILREALAIKQKTTPESVFLGICWEEFSRMLELQGRTAEAESAYREAVALYKRIKDDQRVVSATIRRGIAIFNQGRLGEAEARFREGLEMARRLLGPQGAGCCPPHWLAMVLSAQGKPDEAEPLFRDALDLRRKQGLGEDPRADDTRLMLADVLVRQNKLGEAEALYRENLAIQEKNLPNEWLVFDARSRLGGCLLDEKKYADAEPLLLSGYEGLKQREDQIAKAFAARPAEALQHLVQLYQATGRAEQAARAKAEMLRWYHKAAEGGDAEALNNLAWCLATSQDPKLRDGAGAVNLAEQAVAKTQRKDPGFLDTLAAAYAEAGQFDKAVNVQQEAIALLQDEQAKKDFAARLKLYESNEAYHEH